MSIQFGHTWWGKKWVDSIEDTDYGNRLPRGKNYARKGSVLNIEIKGTKISATVQGSRRRPYQIVVFLKPFKKEEKEMIMQIIANNSAYLSSFLVKKLPEKLFDDCKSKGIHVFPERWKDFKADCSCPDWADCCKHIAAVIYVIGNEIDRNPFLSFLLRDLDIIKELEGKGLAREESLEKSFICSVENLFDKGKKESLQENWEFKNDIFEKIDFTLIPESKEQLFALLSENPLLGTKENFRMLLSLFYKTLRRKIISFNCPFEESPDIIGLQSCLNNKICFNNNLLLEEMIFESDNYRLRIKNEENLLDLLQLIARMPSKKFPSLEKTFFSLVLIYQFAVHLIEKGAFLPEILESKGGFFIRYIPALMIEEVKIVFDQICAIVPENLIEIKNVGGKHFRLSKDETVKTIFALILRTFGNYDYGKFGESKMEKMFFKGDFFVPRAFEEKEVPDHIHLWLSRFHFEKDLHLPVIHIKERKNNFILDVLVEDRTKKLVVPILFNELFSKKKYSGLTLKILRTLELLKEYFPELNQLIDSQGKQKPVIKGERIVEFIFKVLPILRLLQVPILLPGCLKEIVIPKITAKIRKNNVIEQKGYLTLACLMEFEWKIALGSQQLTFEEFKKLVSEKRGIVNLKNEYIYLDEREIQKIMKHFENKKEISLNEKLQMAFSGEYEGEPVSFDFSLKKEIEKIFKIDNIKPPKNLEAKLRPYQQRGYEWLYKNIKIGFGSLIADDMGLGKTVQVISLLLALKNEKRLEKSPALVIVPTTLLTNWAKELKKFAPDLRFSVYHGIQRKLEIKNLDILLTSYSLIRKDMEKFSKLNFSVLILDEAQNIKNPGTNQTKAIKSLKSDIRIAMTGTPIENRLSEYWSIFDFLNRGYLGNLKYFNENYSSPIEKDRDHAKLSKFQKITAPFLLRRLKTDKTIINDLPKKVEIDQYCELSKDQAAIYQNIMENVMKSIESAEGMERRGLIFKLITGLKQVCNHPSHYLKKNDLSACLSGKTALLMNILETIYENNEKVLIFTQYTEMGELLSQMIAEEFKQQILFFHGGVVRKKRDEMVELFQSSPLHKTMILSLKAGGVGLNLTAAKNVVHFDLWWNPAVENQATDRAYRIGQKENVMVHRLITKGTFEEKIDAMIKDKKELANLALVQGEKWIGDWDNKDIREIFGLTKMS